MRYNYNDDIVLALAEAPVDDRTGNKVVYNASWIADGKSMIGTRNEDWVERELKWFFSGSNSLDDMPGPVPQAFQQCAGKDNTVSSAYGHILFGRGEELPNRIFTLADQIVNAFLTKGKSTRHATAIISDRDVHHLSTKNGRQDFICTNALNVIIDQYDKLHIVAQMRSMDAVWGYRADYSMWDALMQWLIGALTYTYPEVTEGHITFQVANLHVYPRHLELLDREAQRIEDERQREVWQHFNRGNTGEAFTERWGVQIPLDKAREMGIVPDGVTDEGALAQTDDRGNQLFTAPEQEAKRETYPGTSRPKPKSPSLEEVDAKRYDYYHGDAAEQKSALEWLKTHKLDGGL